MLQDSNNALLIKEIAKIAKKRIRNLSISVTFENAETLLFFKRKECFEKNLSNPLLQNVELESYAFAQSNAKKVK